MAGEGTKDLSIVSQAPHPERPNSRDEDNIAIYMTRSSHCNEGLPYCLHRGFAKGCRQRFVTLVPSCQASATA